MGFKDSKAQRDKGAKVQRLKASSKDDNDLIERVLLLISRLVCHFDEVDPSDSKLT